MWLRLICFTLSRHSGHSFLFTIQSAYQPPQKLWRQGSRLTGLYITSRQKEHFNCWTSAGVSALFNLFLISLCSSFDSSFSISWLDLFPPSFKLFFSKTVTNMNPIFKSSASSLRRYILSPLWRAAGSSLLSLFPFTKVPLVDLSIIVNTPLSLSSLTLQCSPLNKS